MARKVSKSKLPAVSIIKKFINTIDYQDSYTVELHETDIPIENIYLGVFAHSPEWINNLMKLRNKMAGPFGLKTTTEALTKENLRVGEKAGIFHIYAISENEIIAGDNDIHLNYRVSVLKSSKNLIISTLVQYNNWFGKLYFFIVRPFHKVVTKTILQKAAKNNRI